MSRKLAFDNTGIATVIAANDRGELDDLVTVSVIDRDLTAPPTAAPSNGDRYIPAATATGDWANKENYIAFWNGFWAFIAPTRNMKAWLEDENIFIEYDGTAWVNATLPKLNVEAKTTTYTIVNPDDIGKCFTNTAATTFTLPAATVGQHYMFSVGNASNLTITADGTDTVSLPETGVPGAAGKGLVAGAIGESIHLVCAVAGNWVTMGGTTIALIWVAEA